MVLLGYDYGTNLSKNFAISSNFSKKRLAYVRTQVFTESFMFVCF